MSEPAMEGVSVLSEYKEEADKGEAFLLFVTKSKSSIETNGPTLGVFSRSLVIKGMSIVCSMEMEGGRGGCIIMGVHSFQQGCQMSGSSSNGP